MNDESIHERASERLADYARGELQGPARKELKEHLEACEGCRAELSALESLLAFAGDDLTTHERDDLRSGVLRALHPTPVAELSSRRATGRRIAQVLGAAAVIVLLAVSAAYLGTGSGNDERGGAASTAEGGADQGSGRRLFRGGSEGDAAGAGGGATADAPTPALEAKKNGLSPQSLRRLSREEPLRSFSSYSAQDAERSGRRYLDALANQAPDRATARTIRACGRGVVARQRALPAVAKTGTIEGRKVVVLGYARGEEAGLLDRFMIVVFEIGRCAEPVERLEGPLPPP